MLCPPPGQSDPGKDGLGWFHPPSYDLPLSLLAGLVLAPQGQMEDSERPPEKEPLWAGDGDLEEVLWRSI